MTSETVSAVIAANERYSATFGDKAQLPMPPGRRFLILTCMDARLDPAKFAGLAEGDAHVFRNAGGRVTEDAIRSLAVSHKLLGTREWFVIHHTDCGMEYAHDHQIADMFAGSIKPATLGPDGWSTPIDNTGTVEGRFVHWLAIEDREKALVEDVMRLRHHPLVPADLPIYGYLYDVKTGRLDPVEAAMAAGRPARGA